MNRVNCVDMVLLMLTLLWPKVRQKKKKKKRKRKTYYVTKTTFAIWDLLYHWNLREHATIATIMTCGCYNIIMNSFIIVFARFTSSIIAIVKATVSLTSRQSPVDVRGDPGTIGVRPGTTGVHPWLCRQRPGWPGNIRHSTPDGIEYLISPGWSGMIREV
jgi:hypothetical protein